VLERPVPAPGSRQQTEREKRELDLLLQDALQSARERLAADGGFRPFALALAGRREVHRIEPEGDEAVSVLEAVRAAVMAGAAAGTYRAIALVRDVTVGDLEQGGRTDAVSIALEHEGGTCAQCFLPYDQDDGELRFGALREHEAAPSVFGSVPPQ
jgi:hypothetical protein